ncbi:MAG: hypothetical protein E6Q97_23905 [Desulfurellales bacterium]|nr:MAG: hypothetical protein E6Q97_23905 [Desulfurellales bacterium]
MVLIACWRAQAIAAGSCHRDKHGAQAQEDGTGPDRPSPYQTRRLEGLWCMTPARFSNEKPEGRTAIFPSGFIGVTGLRACLAKLPAV